MGFDGAYALDWTVLTRMADDAGIPTDMLWYEMLAIVEGELITALHPPKSDSGG